MHEKDKSLKFIKEKEKLALLEIKKFFQERFAETEEQEKGSEDHNKHETDSISLTKEDMSKTERTQGMDSRRIAFSEHSVSLDLKEGDLVF